MRNVRIIAVLSTVGPLVFACEKDHRPAESPSANTATYEPEMTPASGVADPESRPLSPPPGEGAAPSPTTDQPAALTDDQIVAITDAANTAEIDASNLALGKSKHSRVRAFAQMMIADHGMNKEQGSKLVTRLGVKPAEGAKLDRLRTEASEAKQTLEAASADTFDRVYIDMQVTDHEKVLDTLDRELIPAARNAELRRSLENFRPKVEHHLREAEKIQAWLVNPSTPQSRMRGKIESGAATNPGSPTNPTNPNNPMNPGSPSNPRGAK